MKEKASFYVIWTFDIDEKINPCFISNINGHLQKKSTFKIKPHRVLHQRAEFWNMDLILRLYNKGCISYTYIIFLQNIIDEVMQEIQESHFIQILLGFF